MQLRFPVQPPFRFRTAAWLPALAVALMSGCATDERLPDTQPPRPADVRAKIVNLLPTTVRDRQGWAVDIYAAFAAMEIAPTASNTCAVLAISEQESGFQADPAVPQLPKISWEEIDRRAESLGVPAFAVRVALKLSSPNGKSYGERIDAVKTERELSEIFEDLISEVPLGKRLFAGLNPVRTGGAMQVSIAFAESRTRSRDYPYPVSGSIRHEVFTRRGGLYFGIAHLLDYPAAYDKPIYRFADFNAGRYASRNAAFQNAVSLASGIPLDLDGDLIRHGAGSDSAPGSTERAVRSLGKRLGMGGDDIRDALEQGGSREFERTTLYARVYELAERIERKPLPRAVLPRIALHGPKIKRKLTTEWFANRVDERHRRCLARAAALGFDKPQG